MTSLPVMCVCVGGGGGGGGLGILSNGGILVIGDDLDRVRISNSWFVIHESNFKFSKQIFFRKLKNCKPLFYKFEFMQKFVRQH